MYYLRINTANFAAVTGIAWLAVNGNPRYQIFLVLMALALGLTNPAVTFNFLLKCLPQIFILAVLIIVAFAADYPDADIGAPYFALLIFGSFVISIRISDSFLLQKKDSTLNLLIGLSSSLLLFGLVFVSQVPIEQYVRSTGLNLYRDNYQEFSLYGLFHFPNVIMGFIPFVHLTAALLPLCAIPITTRQRIILLTSFCLLIYMCNHFVTRTPLFVAVINFVLFCFLLRSRVFLKGVLFIIFLGGGIITTVAAVAVQFEPAFQDFFKISFDRFLFRQTTAGFTNRPDLIKEAVDLIAQQPSGGIRSKMIGIPWAHLFLLDAGLDWGISSILLIITLFLMTASKALKTLRSGVCSAGWVAMLCIFTATIIYGFTSPFTAYYWVLFISSCLNLYAYDDKPLSSFKNA